MKKFPFLFLLISMFLCVSCGEDPFWSDQAAEPMTWDEAIKYCNELAERNHDWHLPTIDELRDRITNCKATRSGGECSVSEENGNLPFGALEEACKGCPDDGETHGTGYGDDEDKGWYWSSSARSEDAIVAFRINFDTGEIGTYNKDHKFKVRCFRENHLWERSDDDE